MQEQPFRPHELFFRAVKPKDIFWKEDGTVSSAAFLSSSGTSVDCLGDRQEQEAIAALYERKAEPGVDPGIVSVTLQNCIDVNTVVKHLPVQGDVPNPYHSEIHGSETQIKLTRGQRRGLAKNAVIRLKPVIAA